MSEWQREREDAMAQIAAMAKAGHTAAIEVWKRLKPLPVQDKGYAELDGVEEETIVPKEGK